MALNDIEEEVILLKAVMELINSMVNFEMLQLVGNDPDSCILFESMTHQRYFNIVLVDFLSCTDKKAFITQTTYLGALKKISKSPNFNFNGSVISLSIATKEFCDWLDQEIEVHELWMPSVEKEITLILTRFDFLKMCGNIAKHNFLRSIGVAGDLKKILSKSGISIELDEAMLALDDFYKQFRAATIRNGHGDN